MPEWRRDPLTGELVAIPDDLSSSSVPPAPRVDYGGASPPAPGTGGPVPGAPNIPTPTTYGPPYAPPSVPTPTKTPPVDPLELARAMGARTAAPDIDINIDVGQDQAVSQTAAVQSGAQAQQETGVKTAALWGALAVGLVLVLFLARGGG